MESRERKQQRQRRVVTHKICLVSVQFVSYPGANNADMCLGCFSRSVVVCVCDCVCVAVCVWLCVCGSVRVWLCVPAITPRQVARTQSQHQGVNRNNKVPTFFGVSGAAGHNELLLQKPLSRAPHHHTPSPLLYYVTSTQYPPLHTLHTLTPRPLLHPTTAPFPPARHSGPRRSIH